MTRRGRLVLVAALIIAMLSLLASILAVIHENQQANQQIYDCRMQAPQPQSTHLMMTCVRVR